MTIDSNDTRAPASWQDDLLTAVAVAYDLPLAPTPPRRMDGAINHVLRVSTLRRDVVIRRHRPESAPDRLSAVHRIQECLRLAGLPLPVILRTGDDRSWLRVDGRLVEVMEYVGPRHEVATWRDAMAIFAELGRLHAALRTVDVAGLPPPAHGCYAPPRTMLALLAATGAGFAAEAGHPDYGRAAATRAFTSDLLRRLDAARPTYASDLPRLLIHGDDVGKNVLVAGDRVVAILDFDRLSEGDRIFEIARTLMYVLSRVVYPRFATGERATGLTDGDLLALARLIGAYATESDWPLTPAESGALPFEMAGAPLFPIVTTGAGSGQAITETLIFAPHVPVARWRADNATRVSDALWVQLSQIP